MEILREKRFEEFVRLLSKLEPAEFFGVCKILMVPIYGEDKEPREFPDIIEDLLDGFLKMKRRPRKELMQLLREWEKEVKKNGTGAEDRQEENPSI